MFPRAWARLPGPVDFIDTVLDDLATRDSVIVGIPDKRLCAILTVEIAELVKHRGLGRWRAIRSAEARKLSPSEYINGEFNGGNPASSILWIDVTSVRELANEWATYVQNSTEVARMPRFCIAMETGLAKAWGEHKRLRRRLWHDFVSPLDTQALVERSGRRSGHRPANIALRSALVSRIAGSDLALAEKLSRWPLPKILSAKDHRRECIWAAQVSVVFPLLERQRLTLLDAHRNLWRVPHTRPDGHVVRNLDLLEIGDMTEQTSSYNLLGVDQELLKWLRFVRNQLAHSKIVPWQQLTSRIALRVADFRE